MESRIDKFFIDGKRPRYVRCYDEPECGDRYTVVLTGRYRKKTSGVFWYLGMSACPFHAQGIGQMGESDHLIDRPAYRHLGKRISFDDLPDQCKLYVLQVYKALHEVDLPPALAEVAKTRAVTL